MINTVAALAGAALLSVTSGTGWEAMPQVDGIYAANPFVINFGSESAKNTLLPYAQFIEAQLEATTDLEFDIVTSPYLDGTPTCAEVPYHTITLRYRSNYYGDGSSHGINCITQENTTWGGWAYINSDYWTIPDMFYADDIKNESVRKNVVSHEFGHILGLSHPNPVDSNGEDVWGNCVPEALQPLLCILSNGYPGGYLAQANAGKFTSYDLNGLNQLIANVGS
jgi:hypothetical protein